MTQNNDSCGTNACESLSREPLVGSAQPITNTVFHIEKMDCPSEERQIRQRLGQIASVESLAFDLAQHKLTVSHRLHDLGPVTAALIELGLPPTPQGRATRADRFHVPRMDCRNEVAQIRERFAQLQGVDDLEFDLKQRILTVHHGLPDVAPITDALASIGMPAVATSVDESVTRSQFHVQKMDCVNEERQVRERLGLSLIHI
jgi:Cd2+/Zn2+-exporting ATPase